METKLDGDELLKLHNEATAEPWVYHGHEGVYGGMITDCNARIIARCDDFDDRPDDFALIVYLRNHAGEIAERLREQGASDDGETIDEAWLKSVGFAREDETFVYRLRFDSRGYESAIVIGLPVQFAALEQVDGVGPEHDECDDSCVQISCPQTRGQLRSLAAALGVALKEPSLSPTVTGEGVE